MSMKLRFFLSVLLGTVYSTPWKRFHFEYLQKYLAKIKIVSVYLKWDQEDFLMKKLISKISWHCPFQLSKIPYLWISWHTNQPALPPPSSLLNLEDSILVGRYKASGTSPTYLPFNSLNSSVCRYKGIPYLPSLRLLGILTRLDFCIYVCRYNWHQAQPLPTFTPAPWNIVNIPWFL